MKIAVLADVHANYRALETVSDHIDRWKPDLVFVAGDIVNRGPRSNCCLRWIEQKHINDGWYVIRGNHEDYVIERDHPNDPKSGTLYELFQPVHFTYQQLNQDVSSLRTLPSHISMDFESLGEIRVLHASMLSNRDGLYPENTITQLEQKISPPPSLFITGHTHRPFIRNVNGSLVVNAGSVGLPFDGDTRATYAQIIHRNGVWQAEIIRLEYDLHRAELDFHDYGFIKGGGPLVDLILYELRLGIGQLYPWVAKYNQPIKMGQISVKDATDEFLKSPITEPYW